MTISDYGLYASVLLSGPTVALICVVLMRFVPAAIAIQRRGVMRDKELMTVGVAWSFTGKLIDIAYWTFTWWCYAKDLEIAPYLIAYGCSFNCFVRKFINIKAAQLHILAIYHNDPEGFKRVACCVSIAIISWTLFVVKTIGTIPE